MSEEDYSFTDEDEMIIEEAVTIAELFCEELEMLEEQHTRLLQINSSNSVLAAHELQCVIKYFKARLGIEDADLEHLYGADPDRVLH